MSSPPPPELGHQTVLTGPRPAGIAGMATATSVLDSTSPVPAMPHPNQDTAMHTASLSSSSSSISDTEQNERKARADRPRMASRKPSASILVPRDHPEIEIEEEEFP